MDKEKSEHIKMTLVTVAKERFKNTLDYEFKNTDLLLEAITHESHRTKYNFTNSNKRLSVFGDSLLTFMMTKEIMSVKKFSSGDITESRSALVNNYILAQIAINANLHTILLHNSDQLEKQIKRFKRELFDDFNFGKLNHKHGDVPEFEEVNGPAPKFLADLGTVSNKISIITIFDHKHFNQEFPLNENY